MSIIEALIDVERAMARDRYDGNVSEAAWAAAEVQREDLIQAVEACGYIYTALPDSFRLDPCRGTAWPFDPRLPAD